MLTIEFLRSFRIGPYAMFDFVASFVGIYVLSGILSKLFLKIGFKISKKSWMLLTIPIGVVAHIISGNITPLTQDFLNLNDHYILKIVILTLTYLGLKDITVANRDKTDTKT